MTTEQINVRIEGGTKAAAEGVLSKIGLTPSDAIRMFYSQIIMRQGLPFEARITLPHPSQKKISKTRINKFVRKHKQTLDELAKR